MTLIHFVRDVCSPVFSPDTTDYSLFFLCFSFCLFVLLPSLCKLSSMGNQTFCLTADAAL